MILRDYQKTAYDEVLLSLTARQNPVLVAPTGSGKTVMGAAIVVACRTKTLWVAHRRELLEQADLEFSRIGVKRGFILSGKPSNPKAMIQLASIQTLSSRGCPDDIELIVVDECHHSTSISYQTLFDRGIPYFGLTATPFRLDGKPLKMYDEIVRSASVARLVKDGFLHEPVVYAAKPIDMSGVRKQGGDFSVSSMDEHVVDRKELCCDIVAEWSKHAKKYGVSRTIVFAINVRHSMMIVEAFRAIGVKAAHVDGSMSVEERSGILNALSRGELELVSNCMLVTEGWDMPQLECAILARPTASLCLHLQQIGRIMRTCESLANKRALVLDHVGNHFRHGAVTRALEYSLEEKVRPSLSGDEELGLMRCQNCGLMFDPPAPCPECEWVPEHTEPSLETKDGVMQIYSEASFETRLDFWNQTEKLREIQGYKDGWSKYKYQERFGKWPCVVAGTLFNPDDACMEDKRRVYEYFLGAADAKGFKPGWASYRYKEVFGVWPRVGQSKDRLETKIGSIYGN